MPANGQIHVIGEMIQILDAFHAQIKLKQIKIKMKRIKLLCTAHDRMVIDIGSARLSIRYNRTNAHRSAHQRPIEWAVTIQLIGLK